MFFDALFIQVQKNWQELVLKHFNKEKTQKCITSVSTNSYEALSTCWMSRFVLTFLCSDFSAFIHFGMRKNNWKSFFFRFGRSRESTEEKERKNVELLFPTTSPMEPMKNNCWFSSHSRGDWCFYIPPSPWPLLKLFLNVIQFKTRKKLWESLQGKFYFVPYGNCKKVPRSFFDSRVKPNEKLLTSDDAGFFLSSSTFEVNIAFLI